jgi:hypothetical protein
MTTPSRPPPGGRGEQVAAAAARRNTAAQMRRILGTLSPNAASLAALDGPSAGKPHELVLLGHGMVAVLQRHLVHDHHEQSRRADRGCAFAR